MRAAACITVFVLAALSTACSELTSSDADNGAKKNTQRDAEINFALSTATLASLVVTPAVDTLDAIAATVKLTAVARNSSGTALSEIGLTWKSLNSAVATVSSNGTVTAQAPGVAAIVATTVCCVLADTARIRVRQTVASITISPASSNLAPGGTVALSAAVKDANGVAISGAPVVWLTSAAAVATVSNAGVVTGISAGTATISARYSEKTANATVTVGAVQSPTQPPPAPPPPPPPSQSTGLLFADNFDAGKKTNANGYSWAPTPLNVSVSRDIAYNGGYSLKFHYPGKPSPCGDATAEQRLGLGEDLHEAWFEYYLYLPDGTEGLGAKFQHRLPACPSGGDANGVINNNKFFAIWDNDYANQDVKVVFEYRRMTTGTANDSYLYGMHGTDTRPTGQYGSTPWSPSFSSATRGRWVQIRIHVKVATSKTAKDGGYQLWANGQLIIDELDRDLAPDPGGHTFFRNLYLMGWANSGFDQDTNVYIDDFKVFGSNPGW